MKNLFLSLFALVFLSACGSNPAGSEWEYENGKSAGIVGAEKINTRDRGFRATVSLEFDGQVYCNGTLIGKKHILTAAHCLNRDPAFMSVRFHDGTEGHIRSWVAHADYNGEAGMKYGIFSVTSSDEDDHDIGLILLEAAAPSSAVIAKLPSKSLPRGSYKIRTYGSGNSASGKNDGGTLKMVNLQGAVRKGKEGKIYYNQKGGKGICEGDSGGPHFVYEKDEPVLVGFTMEGDEFPAFLGVEYGDGCRQGVGVALQTAPYLLWIAKAKRELK